MKYKYPKISNTLSYKRIDENLIEVTEHLTDNVFELEKEIVDFARKLDGRTHPYKIESVLSGEERDEVIDFFGENCMIRCSNNLHVPYGMILKTLWVPEMTKSLRVFAYVSNFFLMVLWLPVLICGIILFSNRINYTSFDGMLIGYFIGLFSGLICHELAHAFAAISYRARVFEAGVMVMYYVLPGAYVLMDRKAVKSRLKRIQINAAGVEANFFIAGLSLILGAILPDFGGALFNAALCNIFIGLMNLSFIQGLDGTNIISDLLGIEGIVEQAKQIVFNRKKRKEVAKRKNSGHAIVAMCYILFVLQIALPVLLISNILEVVSCFV